MQRNAKLTVTHYIQLKKHNIMTAYEILAMVVLSKHKNYIPIWMPDTRFNGVYIVYSNSRHIYLSLFEKNDDCWDCIKSKINGDLYCYLERQKKKFDKKGILLKEPVHKVIDYVKFVEDSMVFDQNISYYSEGAVCFSCIDAEIIISMFRDIGYFGFPENHPYVIKLIETYRHREAMFHDDSKARKRMLFDQWHMREMMRSGISVNHVEHFNPLSKKQMREYFNGLIEATRRTSQKIAFKFFKDITVKDSYVYAADSMFHTYYPTNEKTRGFSMMLDNYAVNEIMTDFTEYVWKHMTYSTEESIRILERMMEEYL